MVFIKKVYGQSQVTECYFCLKPATTETELGIPACNDHKTKELKNEKCLCGKALDVKKSRFGAFFLCSSCGPISLKKAKQTKADASEYNINKAFRQKKEPSYKENKVYTLDELEDMWK